MIDRKGYRQGVAMVITNQHNKLFWAKRIGQNAWQFPQGGLLDHETPEEAMYRELHEEVGLQEQDIEIIAQTKDWLRYRLPKHLLRHDTNPLCIGQRQRYFLLRLIKEDRIFRFDSTNSPEFDHFRWVSYWHPLNEVIAFKRKVYKKALNEFAPLIFNT